MRNVNVFLLVVPLLLLTDGIVSDHAGGSVSTTSDTTIVKIAG